MEDVAIGVGVAVLVVIVWGIGWVAVRRIASRPAPMLEQVDRSPDAHIPGPAGREELDASVAEATEPTAEKREKADPGA